MNNLDFNLTGFREVKMLSAETGFALSPKQWIIMTKSGLLLPERQDFHNRIQATAQFAESGLLLYYSWGFHAVKI
jgi:hypothetical protein